VSWQGTLLHCSRRNPYGLISQGAWEDIDVVQPLQLDCPNGQYNDLAVLLMGPHEASIKLLMEQDAGKLFFCPLSLAFQAVLFYVTMCVTRTLASPSGMCNDCLELGCGVEQGTSCLYVLARFQWSGMVQSRILGLTDGYGHGRCTQDPR
jgi:hypothetical protein